MRCGTSETFPKPDPATLEAQYSEAYYGLDNVKFVPAVEAFVAWMTRKQSRTCSCFDGKDEAEFLRSAAAEDLLLRQLAQLGHESHGIERSALAARRAARSEGLRIYTQPLEKCHFPEQYFDAVILWHVLEHLDHPQTTLALISRVLKPGGLLYLEVPNLTSLQSCTTARIGFISTWSIISIISRRTGCTGCFCRVGFKVEKTTTLSLEQGPYGVLQSWLNAIGPEQGLLYRILKREVSPPLGATFGQLVLAGMLAAPSLFFALIEAAIGRGGVLRVVARSGQKLMITATWSLVWKPIKSRR